MSTLTDQQIWRNMRDVAHAIAQQELEGLKVSKATVEGMERASRGEIGPDQVIRNIRARLNHAQILRR